MKERRVLVKAFAEKYRKAGKKEKGSILAGFTEATGYARRYAARLLRGHGKRLPMRGGVVLEGDAGLKARRRRKRTYDEGVKQQLRRLWEMLDYLCGKRLAPALPALIEALERHRELKLDGAARRKLLKISASTIDRLLGEEKRRLALKGRSGTKPGTLLRHQIPIRTYAEWDEARPGFMEVDLVAHEGGLGRGDYAQTLDMTDVATGWTELAAVPNKAQTWVFEEIERMRARLPFPLLGLDSDNGSEFINHHLQSYCALERITFTRSRPLRKNDNCFVEQKNYSVVRRFVGYARYDAPAELEALKELYDRLRLYVNFFLPSHKLLEKIRRGSRVRKRYDRAQTPYQRALKSGHVSAACKKALRAQCQTLNPAQLRREIVRLQEKLTALAARKRSLWAVDGAASDGKVKTFSPEAWKTPAEFSTPPTAPAAAAINTNPFSGTF